jgi:acyl-CoA synthetase (AMP-forming)/AMP-acid ligase II
VDNASDQMGTLIELLDEAVARWGERPALSVRRDDGTTETWSYRELDRRTRLAAYRLRALGLEPGDRIITWSPSRSELAAAYFGAMRAGLVFVPLDLRMSADAIQRVRDKSGAKHLVIGAGRDAPDPRDANLEGFPRRRSRSSRLRPMPAMRPVGRYPTTGRPRCMPGRIPGPRTSSS